MTVRWALVGSGEIAEQRVAPAIAEHAGSVLVATVDVAPERAEAMAVRFGAHAFTEMREALTTCEVDAVYVATPPRHHCEPTVAAARAGAHVLCEKPMAPTLAQCRLMMDAAEEAGVALAVSYYRRWYPAAREIKRLLDEGAIGTPIRARILTGWPFERSPGDDGYWRVEEGGGPLMDTACHRVDLMCYWLGEPARVAALRGNMAYDWPAPDTEALLCEMASGVHLTCETQWSLPLGFDEMEVHGTEGSVVASPFDGEHLVLRTPKGRHRMALEKRDANVHLPLIASFAECVAAGRQPEFDARDGMQSSRIIDAAVRSAASEQWEACG
jgi:predicted dehydrogenase